MLEKLIKNLGIFEVFLQPGTEELVYLQKDEQVREEQVKEGKAGMYVREVD